MNPSSHASESRDAEMPESEGCRGSPARIEEKTPPSLLPSEPPQDAPEVLRAAWPLVQRWTQREAAPRGAIIGSASDDELEKFMAIVDPLFLTILAYMEETEDADRAAPYAKLAQAALEARFELESRV